MSNYGNSFRIWRETVQPDWQKYAGHEFVTRLGEGSLPRAAFLKYLVQDYLFLFHYARAWALGVTKAETIEEMQACAKTVHSLTHEEIRMHVRICAEAGIDEDSLFAAGEETANLAYTRYVLDAGHSGDFLDLMAALAPCVLGYGEIGARLLPMAGGNDYGDWINTYGGDSYQQLCHDVGILIDDAVHRRLGEHPESSPRWTSLCRRFRMATRLEAGFWDMGLDV